MKRIYGLLGLVLVMLLILAAPALAAPPSPNVPATGGNPPRAHRRRPVRPWIGEIVDVADDALTILLPNGEQRTIVVDGETHIIVPEVVDASLADLQAGMRVRVGLYPEGGIPPRAETILMIPEDAAYLRGEIRDIGVDGFTIETRLAQTISVTVNAATRYWVPGAPEAALEQLQAGDQVRLGGQWIDAAMFHAWLVHVEQKDRVTRVRGRILEIDEQSFKIGTLDGLVTVVPAEEARYRVRGNEEAEFASLHERQWVQVVGEWKDEGAFVLARLIVGMPGGGLLPR